MSSMVFTLHKGDQVFYVADGLKQAKQARPGPWVRDENRWGVWTMGEYTITHEDWNSARERLCASGPSEPPTEG